MYNIITLLLTSVDINGLPNAWIVNPYSFAKRAKMVITSIA